MCIYARTQIIIHVLYIPKLAHIMYSYKYKIQTFRTISTFEVELLTYKEVGHNDVHARAHAGTHARTRIKEI